MHFEHLLNICWHSLFQNFESFFLERILNWMLRIEGTHTWLKATDAWSGLIKSLLGNIVLLSIGFRWFIFQFFLNKLASIFNSVLLLLYFCIYMANSLEIPYLVRFLYLCACRENSTPDLIKLVSWARIKRPLLLTLLFFRIAFVILIIGFGDLWPLCK